MNKIISVTCSIFLFFIASTGLACDYPQRITVPDGTTTSEQDLLAAQKDVKTFISTMETYLECIVEEEKLARLAIEDLAPEVEQQREEMLNKKYNAAWDEEKRIEAQWNAAVQAYKTRSDK
jgi:hypothetical protein